MKRSNDGRKNVDENMNSDDKQDSTDSSNSDEQRSGNDSEREASNVSRETGTTGEGRDDDRVDGEPDNGTVSADDDGGADDGPRDPDSGGGSADRAELVEHSERLERVEAALWRYDVESTGLVNDAASIPFDADLFGDRPAIRARVLDAARRDPSIRSASWGTMGHGAPVGASTDGAPSLTGILRSNA